MKVLVIFTGGTIGSKTENNIIDIKSNSYHILEKYNKAYPNTIEFEVIQPINQLSENFTLDTLEMLGNTILNVDTSNYDGIIITHGSDTLCYTSPFIGMITRHFDIPVVMVASNHPIDELESNGIDNFHGAIQLIQSKKVRGCFVVWKDSITHRTIIHLGTRLRECDSLTDTFQSYGGTSFGEIVDNEIMFNGSHVNPTLEEINATRTPICENICLSNRSMLIRSYTGLDYSNINLNNVASVVIYLYHSGTACTIDEGESILKFINKYQDKAIYVASLKRVDKHYSTANDILNSGVIPMYNISPESAYIKSLILSNVEVSAKEDMFFEEI